ncbi:DUF4230 domain-containing protein [Psychrobacillus sp. OK032]|uniref:DUF4230 domain-containing protein n=1 Tax=Psychrobacillus sp. OK032 TaxID=1884358 RepID=UPI0008CA4CF0|nr:DUF4230 domain-containing protein [Psychrobacillus sp. OK032]SER88637.1 Protein of unknown function [Psychrobacillus sp. OK032]
MSLNLRKLATFALVVITAVVTLTACMSGNKASSIEKEAEQLSVPTTHIIDKQTVITALTENLQIVGLEGVVEKEFRYTDAKWFGDKTFDMTLHGTFKTGFNIADITAANVVITANNEIIINTPDIELIALELPYDAIVIDKQVGALRKDFTEVDRQLLYAKASASVRKEIEADGEVRKQSEQASQRAIEAILALVPGVTKITFN